MTDRDVYLHTLPTFHCNGWGMPYAVTGMGVRQVIIRKIDGEEILRRVESEGVTLFNCAPAVIAAVLDAAAARRQTGVAVPGRGRVRVVVAGAPPPSKTIERVDESIACRAEPDPTENGRRLEVRRRAVPEMLAGLRVERVKGALRSVRARRDVGDSACDDRRARVIALEVAGPGDLVRARVNRDEPAPGRARVDESVRGGRIVDRRSSGGQLDLPLLCTTRRVDGDEVTVAAAEIERPADADELRRTVVVRGRFPKSVASRRIEGSDRA